jgi:hypothetical protein
MRLAFRDVEVDAVEGDDLAEGFRDPARTNCEPSIAQDGRGPAGDPAGRRVVMLFACRPETRQFVSELGMYAPGTCAGA